MVRFLCAALELKHTHRLDDEHKYISENLCQKHNSDKKIEPNWKTHGSQQQNNIPTSYIKYPKILKLH